MPIVVTASLAAMHACIGLKCMKSRLLWYLHATILIYVILIQQLLHYTMQAKVQKCCIGIGSPSR